MNGAWTGNGGQDNCCGDDIGEGGFVYGDSSYGTPEVTSTSGNGLNGEYQPVETVCDDYYGGDSTLIENWIDNDCENGANCEDWHCYNPAGGADPRRGPSGGYCCGGSSPENRCKDAIDPSARSSNGVACGDNLECDCIAVEGEQTKTTAQQT